MSRAVIALGSHHGDRLHTLRSAIAGISELGTLAKVSSLFEAIEAKGAGRPSYHAVVVLDTDLPADALVLELRGIETIHPSKGRGRSLDLDLILHGDDAIATGGVTIPHPRALERRHVLEPLVEVLPDVAFPGGPMARDALGEVLDQELWREGKGKWWRQGFTHRGGWWVVGQVIGLGLWVIAAAMDPYSYGNSFTNGLGIVMVTLGLVLGFLAMRGLGRRLTPYPEPVGSSTLVQTGAYALARHPIYGAILMLAGGASLLVGSQLALLATVILAAFFWWKAGSEEQRLIRTFHEYPAYRDRVRWRLIPWVL